MKKIVALVLSLVMVLGLATTAFAAAGMEAYTINETTGKWQLSTGLTGCLTGMDEFADFATDPDEFVPSYVISGSVDVYYVEATESTADVKVVYGSKTLYLAEVTNGATVLAYDNKVVALDVVAEDDAECGDYYITDAAVLAYAATGEYDEDSTFYAHYNKKGLVDAVYVADKVGYNTQVLVDGNLVKAYKLDADDVVFAAHAWVGYEVVNYEYTSVICKNCGNVAKLYSNATAAGAKAVRVPAITSGDPLLGWISFADATNYGAVVEAPEATDKVESAETFDAGIAMYVGMSVMAAAGSAVVLKKKD